MGGTGRSPEASLASSFYRQTKAAGQGPYLSQMVGGVNPPQVRIGGPEKKRLLVCFRQTSLWRGIVCSLGAMATGLVVYGNVLQILILMSFGRREPTRKARVEIATLCHVWRNHNNAQAS